MRKMNKLKKLIRKEMGKSLEENKDLSFDDSSHGEIVEQVGEELPNIGVSIFSAALVVEAVDLCDLSAFVVAPEDGESVWVSHLEGEEEGHTLHAVVPSVHVISHEQVVGFLTV